MGRRSHTKSRKGCFECKRRHIKCNEVRPICGNCRRLESECNWPPRKVVPPPPYARGSVAATAAGGGTSGALSSSLTSPPLAVADLRLLHHFILVASEQIGQAVTGRIVWGDDVVKLGFNHHFLLRGILAVSALHLAVTTMDRQESDGADAASSGGTPGGGGGGGGVSSTSVVSDRENVAELLLQSAVHMDAALGEFRMLLQQSRAESSEQTYTAVFFLACLLTVHGFGSFRTQPDSDPIDAFIHCAGLIQGAKLMQLPTGWASLKTDDISAIVSLARRQRQAFIYQKPEIGLLRERICAMSLPSPPISPRVAMVYGPVTQTGSPAMLQAEMAGPGVAAGEWPKVELSNGQGQAADATAVPPAVTASMPASTVPGSAPSTAATAPSPTPALSSNTDLNIDTEADRMVYLRTIDELNDTFSEIESYGRHQPLAIVLMCAWPASLSNSFMALLARRRPLALVILAHFAVLLGDHANSWYLGGWDKYLLDAVEKAIPPGFEVFLAWPRRCIRGLVV